MCNVQGNKKITTIATMNELIIIIIIQMEFLKGQKYETNIFLVMELTFFRTKKKNSIYEFWIKNSVNQLNPDAHIHTHRHTVLKNSLDMNFNSIIQ